MTDEELFAKVDHTLLKPTATWAQIRTLCDEALQYHTASVCIPPSYVARVKAAYGGRLVICTVIGFPNGYNTTEAKVFETRDAVEKGADEVDMVIDQGFVKDGSYDLVTAQIAAVRAAAGDRILKVIIETCNLTAEEIAAVSRCVTEAGADFIKTSTGFGSAGASFAGVQLMKENIGPGVRIKAAGGIRTREDMEQFCALGCDRLGTSSAIRILRPEK